MNKKSSTTFIIELRVNGTLIKDGIHHDKINTTDTFYAKTFNIKTGIIEEYNSYSTFRNQYRDSILVSYTYTDIQFIKCLTYEGEDFFTRHDKDTIDDNYFFKKQKYLYQIQDLDSTNFGLLYTKNIENRTYKTLICNLPKLILTSPLNFNNFLRNDKNYIIIPAKQYFHSYNYYWKIEDKERLDDIINRTRQSINTMQNILINKETT